MDDKGSACRWLNWGAIISAIMCIVIHGAIGVTPEGIIEMVTTMIIIYGMLMAKEFTGNEWGGICLCVFMERFLTPINAPKRWHTAFKRK